MKAKVLRIFRDGKDGEVYKKGASYENENVDRVAYLQEQGFLEKTQEAAAPATVEEKEDFPKHAGGSTFLLSNGEKVQGKEAALKAQEELNKEGE